jgi:hypothetical protein
MIYPPRNRAIGLLYMAAGYLGDVRDLFRIPGLMDHAQAKEHLSRERYTAVPRWVEDSVLDNPRSPFDNRHDPMLDVMSKDEWREAEARGACV